MPDTVLSGLYRFTHSSFTKPYKVLLIHVPQMGKLRPNEVNYLVSGHPACQWQGWDLHPAPGPGASALGSELRTATSVRSLPRPPSSSPAADGARSAGRGRPAARSPLTRRPSWAMRASRPLPSWVSPRGADRRRRHPHWGEKTSIGILKVHGANRKTKSWERGSLIT